MWEFGIFLSTPFPLKVNRTGLCVTVGLGPSQAQHSEPVSTSPPVRLTKTFYSPSISFPPSNGHKDAFRKSLVSHRVRINTNWKSRRVKETQGTKSRKARSGTGGSKCCAGKRTQLQMDSPFLSCAHTYTHTHSVHDLLELLVPFTWLNRKNKDVFPPSVLISLMFVLKMFQLSEIFNILNDYDHNSLNIN